MPLNFLHQIDGLLAGERFVPDALPPCCKRSQIILPVDDSSAKLVLQMTHPPPPIAPHGQRQGAGQSHVQAGARRDDQDVHVR